MMNSGTFPLPALYIVFFTGMLLVSVLINGLLLKFSLNLGSKNEFSQVRWASTTKPAFGGVSFYLLFLLAIVFYSLFFDGGQLLRNLKFLGMLISVSLGFVMGLADDAYNTRPFLKFAVQFACGLTFIFCGLTIKVFPWDWLNYTTTVFWVVGMMNSINMLDNMDGITSSVSSVICMGAVIILILAGNYGNLNLVVLVGVIAGIFGFLYYNWHPSRMYMGDSGSQFLGVFLAATGVDYFWNAPDAYLQVIQSKQIIVALLIFVVPIADTTTVSINRLLKGHSPFVGGRDHTTHHLAYLGFSDRQIAMIMIGISLFTMMVSIFVINYIHDWQVWHACVFGGLFLGIVAALYSTSQLSKSKIPG